MGPAGVQRWLDVRVHDLLHLVLRCVVVVQLHHASQKVLRILQVRMNESRLALRVTTTITTTITTARVLACIVII